MYNAFVGKLSLRQTKLAEVRRAFIDQEMVSLSSREEGNSLFVPAKVLNAHPLMLELSGTLNERTLEKLSSLRELIVAHPQKGTAYTAHIISKDGRKLSLEIQERFETRSSLRAEAQVIMGYEVTRSMQIGGGLKEDEMDKDDRDALNQATAKDTSEGLLARLLVKILDELKQWRTSFAGSNGNDPNAPRSRKVSLSGSGIKFYDQNERSVGDVLQLYLELAGVAHPISCSARVVRVETEFNDETRKMDLAVACQFKEITESDRENVIKYVFQAHRAALKRGDW